MGSNKNKKQKIRVKEFFSETAALYKEKYLDKNLGFQRFTFLARRQNLVLMLSKEVQKKGEKFKLGLDIGCGTGDYLTELLHFSEKVIGADYAEGMLLESREKIRGNENNISLSQEDIENMSFSDNYFDFVICAGVLEYLNDETKALKEIYRVLKPGRSAFITFPNKFSPFIQLDELYSVLLRFGGEILDKLNIFELVLGRKRANAPSTIHRSFSPLKVKRKVKSLGFEHISDVFSGYGSFYLCVKIPNYSTLANKLEYINKLPLLRHSALNYIIQIEKLS